MTTVSSLTDPSIAVRGTKGVGAGRSLQARKGFKPGALIATFTDPVLVLPNGPSAKVVCNHCLAHNKPTKACTGCKAVVYCGPSCQRAHWTLIHKLECKVFRRVQKSVEKDWLPTSVRALVQVLLQWDADEELRKRFGALEGNVDKFKLREDVWKDVGLQAYGGMAYSGRKETDDELNMARDILCKVRNQHGASARREAELTSRQIQTNSFDRTDVDTGQAGIFLHQTLAMCNHSCIPNAVVAFSGRHAMLRAELPIKEGDEITISYIGRLITVEYFWTAFWLTGFQTIRSRDCSATWAWRSIISIVPVHGAVTT